LRAVKPAYLFTSLHKYNKGQFKTAEATQLFNRYATYNGSNPYKAPAMLSLIPHLEMNEGTFYPKGGMISITNALHKLALHCGVTFHFNIVVSNQDVYFTYKHLLQQESQAQKVLKQERSSSALIFYWGIGRSFEELGLHNIFFSGDYQGEFEHIFKSGTLHPDPTVYINITSKMEAGLAPDGKENWFVMVNVPANKGQDWEVLKKEAKKAVLHRISKALGTDIEPLIETEATLDPVIIESKTMSYMGSLYGTSSNSKLAAFFRHPNFSKQYKDLYFVGGSVHPGGGIPLCLRSAAIMSEIVAKSG
jgi:phytoene dehydrogenase-like protein